MEHKEQEKMPLPFSSFTTLRGKKGYPAEEVEEYCSTVNTEYSKLEQEYRKLDSEVSELALQLGQEQEEHRAAALKAAEFAAAVERKERECAELNGRYEELLTAPKEDRGLSALEREEYQQSKEALVRQNAEMMEKEQELIHLRSANEDFLEQIAKLKLDAEVRQDCSDELREAQGKVSLLQAELAILQQEKEELEGERWVMNEKLISGQEALQAEIHSLYQQLAEKDGEIERLKAECAEMPAVSGEVVDENSLSTQQDGIPVGYASKYVDIFEIVRSAADRYAFETEEKMNSLLSESEETARQKIVDANTRSKETMVAARTEADELLEESRIDAENIKQEAEAKLESARRKSEEIVRNAEQRAVDAIAKANEELKGIRTLINQHSQEYRELSAQKVSESELL
jgi:Membrane-bound metallopeptidase